MGVLSKPQDPHCKNLWKTLIKSASNVHCTGKCPQRDITCADGHENVVGIEFSVEAAQVKVLILYFAFLIFVLFWYLLSAMMSDNIRNIGICERGNNSPHWLPPILLPFPLTQSSPFENCYYDIQLLDAIPHILHFDFDIFWLSACGLLIEYHSIDLIIGLNWNP